MAAQDGGLHSRLANVFGSLGAVRREVSRWWRMGTGKRAAKLVSLFLACSCRLSWFFVLGLFFSFGSALLRLSELKCLITFPCDVNRLLLF